MIRNPARFFDLQSLAYIGRSAGTYMNSARWRCPCCDALDYCMVFRKAIVTALVRCQSCQLLYRCPGDPAAEESKEFYQEDYVSGGLTTSMPSQRELAGLKASGFRNSQKDFTQKISVLAALGMKPGARVLDFGASWGYATWQMKEAGYLADGYEISKSRSRYGSENLDLNIASSITDLTAGYDAVFSSHVIEHFSNPREAFEIAMRLLNPGGKFIAFTPNGSLKRVPLGIDAYNHSWGRLHPVYLDEIFYNRNAPDVPKLFTSRDYGDWRDLKEIDNWDQSADLEGDLTKPELLFVFTVPEKN